MRIIFLLVFLGFVFTSCTYYLPGTVHMQYPPCKRYKVLGKIEGEACQTKGFFGWKGDNRAMTAIQNALTQSGADTIVNVVYDGFDERTKDGGSSCVRVAGIGIKYID